MLFVFSTPVLIRYLWQLKAVVFLYWCLICAVLLFELFKEFCLISSNFFIKEIQFNRLDILKQGCLSGKTDPRTLQEAGSVPADWKRRLGLLQAGTNVIKLVFIVNKLACWSLVKLTKPRL